MNKYIENFLFEKLGSKSLFWEKNVGFPMIEINCNKGNQACK